jgi:predicted house-cleaning noncanonical NTP pyrophosphatase (MazG superfamily)
MGKLVRDGIPDKIRANGEVPRTKKLDDDKLFLHALGKKATEEASEFADAEDIEAKLDKLADLEEVVDAALIIMGMTRDALAVAQANKRRLRGDFDERIYLLDEDEEFPRLCLQLPLCNCITALNVRESR